MLPYKQLPKRPLGFFPTPIVELKRLSNFLGGPRMFIKRDDHTGLAMGGNKTRKLEFLMGDALAKGADTVITAGAAQSNHCRQTAAAAAVCGLECHLALGGTPPDLFSGNLLLDRLFGARIHWSGEQRKGETVPTIVEELRQAGKTPYTIPYGGSNELGAAAFAEAVGELDTQIGSSNDDITHLVFASSSGGTHAGLLVGKRIFEKSFAVVGINIDKEETYSVPLALYIRNLANNTAEFLQVSVRFAETDVVLYSDFVGEGYGVVGDLEQEAISLLARQEGILLDPVYTGRAFGGLLELIRRKEITKDHTVLFWHTGGSPALFSYAAQLLRD